MSATQNPRPAAETTSLRSVEVDAFTRRVLNPLIGRLTRWGFSVMGTRILAVRGRTSGEIRSAVVNELVVDDASYLVAPRGHTQWVRNLRVAGTGTLRVGRRTHSFDAVELADDAKLPVLREYLAKWGWEVGKFVDGLSATSTDDELRAAAPGFPVFRIERAVVVIGRRRAVRPATRPG